MHEHDQDLLREGRTPALDALPALTPPARSRRRVLAAMHVAAQDAAPPRARAGRLTIAAGIGAIALGAALLAGYGLIERDRPDRSAVAMRPVTAFVAPPVATHAIPARTSSTPVDARPLDARPVVAARADAPFPHATNADLRETSRELERLLAELPEQRRLMRVGTVSTITALEDQIAVIDARLMLGAESKLEPEIEETLWQERVDAMNALVQLRYAQSRLFTY